MTRKMRVPHQIGHQPCEFAAAENVFEGVSARPRFGLFKYSFD
jgi:hypothetical protein